MHVPNKIKLFSTSLWLFLILFYPQTHVRAEIVSFTSRLNLQGDYYDNVSFDRENPTSDYLIKVEPSFSLGYRTEQFNLNSTARFDLGRYVNETYEDRKNQQYSINGGYSASERVSFTGGVSYRFDSTQDAVISETGELTAFQDRHWYAGRGGLNYRFSELFNIGLNYDYTKYDYAESSGTDFDRHAVALSFNRNLKTGRDTLTFKPSYYHQAMEYGELDYYSASIGWLHRFSERFLFNAYVGGRREERTYGNWEEESDGIIANVVFQRKYDTGSFSLGYYRDLQSEVGGGQKDMDRISCRWDKQILPRLGMSFNGTLFMHEEPAGTSDENTSYFEVKPSIYYMLTEKQVIEVGYAYANAYDSKYAENRSVDRNMVWIVVRLVYDTVW